MEKDIINVCSIHDRIQIHTGKWIEKVELDPDIYENESPCDLCEDLNNIDVDFQEVEL